MFLSIACISFYITIFMESQSHFLQEPQTKKKSVTPILAITPDIRPGRRLTSKVGQPKLPKSHK
ncbi:hypothetical protein DAPPUDRAFT_266703 [Daphnia pulex]|uniref:Uncharacterized protein n=1 Tax=Daphnia pulex TaxID=6669 RepID=E9HVH6_DAPPU|nr:hypothetical protein DAPPUDRAFT_266703 [Daphnia pulex]|eukprot:EFX64256.1 hypothetical protein DAPPUDRAFT_266703 [Daphnia pulex]